MVTDILAKDTDLYVAGDVGPLELAFGHEVDGGVIPLPGRHEPQEAGRAESPCRAVNLGKVEGMALRKQKSRKEQVTDLAIDYLKLKTAGKAAKGAGKGAKKVAKGTAVYKVGKKTPVVKRIPVIVGAGVAAIVATKVVKGRSGQPAAT